MKCEKLRCLNIKRLFSNMQIFFQFLMLISVFKASTVCNKKKTENFYMNKRVFRKTTQSKLYQVYCLRLFPFYFIPKIKRSPRSMKIRNYEK